LDPDCLREELANLPAAPKLAVDAKVPASDIQSSQLLMNLGFRTVATMFHLTHTLLIPAEPSLAASIVPRLDLPDETIWRHARNFRYDRFNADPLLDHEASARLFFQWVTNSLTQGRQQVIHIGPNFCTFSLREDGDAVIDLVSVLEHRKGIGKALIGAATNEARRLGARRLHVTTECQNAPAWKLYLGSGFQPSGYTCAMHLVRNHNSNGQSLS
jgi:GNAT superfamily N-acetyltransferase